jgi:hypothetical protein
MERYSPDTLGYVINAENNSGDDHGKKRLVVSQAVLTMLSQFVISRVIPANATVAAYGSTIQARAGGGAQRGGIEFAHQVLRELSIDGVPVHLLEGLSEEEARVLLYCNSAVSRIPARYNTVDGLIEAQIRGPFVELASWVMREAGARPLMSILAMKQVLQGETWKRLLAIFIQACTNAKGGQEDGSETRSILDKYIREAEAFSRQADLLARFPSQEIYRKTAADWCAYIAPRVQPKRAETAVTLRQKRAALRTRVLRDLEVERIRIFIAEGQKVTGRKREAIPDRVRDKIRAFMQ